MSIVYSAEQIEFLREHIKDRSYAQLAAAFNKRFGTAASRGAIRGVCRNQGISFEKSDLGLYTIYSDEQRQFLKDNVQDQSYTQLAVLFNRRFGTNINRMSIRGLCRCLGLSNEKPDRRPYSDEQISFLRENADGRNYQELTEMFNRHFNTDATANRIGDLCRRNGFTNGIDCRFQDGHIVNLGRKFDHTLPDGSEMVSVDGYIIMKHNGAWRTKQSAIWEDAHGAIPSGYHVIFGDGDKRNFDLANLYCIPAAQACIMTNMGLKSKEPELAEAGVALAGLYAKINERKRRNRK